MINLNIKGVDDYKVSNKLMKLKQGKSIDVIKISIKNNEEVTQFKIEENKTYLKFIKNMPIRIIIE